MVLSKLVRDVDAKEASKKLPQPKVNEEKEQSREI